MVALWLEGFGLPFGVHSGTPEIAMGGDGSWTSLYKTKKHIITGFPGQFTVKKHMHGLIHIS